MAGSPVSVFAHCCSSNIALSANHCKVLKKENNKANNSVWSYPATTEERYKIELLKFSFCSLEFVAYFVQNVIKFVIF